ncbi:ABC transporter ATP-binding protein [Streptomyces malaysiense]|uniref:ABC transporter ATP-binding protein n=1 Tax=Streptomyces malaysiense TaxID=1428626 RepID=UPI0009A0F6F9|nr:ABC transporter ATP-binding protein [Streptomyces malaysiense]
MTTGTPAGPGAGGHERSTAPPPAPPGRVPAPAGPAAAPSARTAARPAAAGNGPEDARGAGRRLLRTLRPERHLIGATLALAAVGVALSILGPKLLGHATDLLVAGMISRRFPVGTTTAQMLDRLHREGHDSLAHLVRSAKSTPGHGVDFDAVGQVLLLALLLYVASALFNLLQGRLTSTVIQRAMGRLRADAQAKLARVPLAHFDRESRGEILSRVTNDIDNLGQTLQQTISQVITALLTIVGVMAVMLTISPLLFLAALSTVPLSLYASRAMARRARPQFAAQWAATGQLNSRVEEAYSGHALVRTFGRGEETVKELDECNEAAFASGARAQFVSGVIQPVMTFTGNLGYVLVAVAGALRVASGALSLGDVQAFLQYSRQFSQPLNQVAGMANLLQSGMASAERVFALIDAEEESADPVAARRPDRVRGRVTFEDVSFRYVADAPLIENLSLTVEPGQTVAIVGPTGAGKTTLVNLLMRFYEVDAGRITLDGVDIATMSRADVRSVTGMVLQDPWLFHGTIAENIAYGVRDPEGRQTVEAARATHVDHLVRTLPDGYETVVDDESSSVSAGEKQLLTIARAWFTNPSILILDEATSSVDTRTEALIQRAMASLRQGRTSFIIAHRLSTIRDADLILVMESGSVVEQGTHEQLLATGGAYARLYQAQFAGVTG